MIEILDSAKHVVAMRISSELKADDITKAYKATEDALKDNDRISFFVEVDPTLTLTVEGVVKDVVEGIRQLGQLSRYYRAAVVTDKGWLATIARVEGLVFCSIDVRVFESSERHKALAWAAEDPPPATEPVEPDASIHFLQTTSENVFAYELNGRLRERDIKTAIEQVNPFLEREGKFNVLARLKDFGGFDVLSVLDDKLIRLKLKAPSKIAKYAIVGAKPWMRNLIELAGGLVSTEIRTFELSEEAAAWEWVGAQQALLPE